MRQITVEEARDLLVGESPPQLVDCREPWEYALGHLADAVLLPLGELAERVSELDPTRPVLVYCHAGVRSINGAVLLERAGLVAMSMRGGTEAWSRQIDPGIPRY